MSTFAVEVPGKVQPLTLPEVGRALQAASSLEYTQRQSGSQQLQSWETKSGYYPCLQAAFLDRRLPHDIRLLAVILLRNGIDKYWRRTARSAMSQHDKDMVRARLMEGSVAEPDRALAMHNAFVTAKVLRIEYPQDWPSAVNDMMEAVRATKSADQRHLSGALALLMRGVKELSTVCMARSQKALQDVAPELLRLVGEVYTERTASWGGRLSHGMEEGNEEVGLALQNSLKALKILRRLAVFGYDRPHIDDVIPGLWTLSQSQFDAFLGLVRQGSTIPASCRNLVEMHLIQFAKLHINMCERHPGSFTVLPNSAVLVKAYWGLVREYATRADQSSGIKASATSVAGGATKMHYEGPLAERLALKGLVLVRECVSIAKRPKQTFRYRSPEVKQDEKDAAEAVQSGILVGPFLTECVEIIIRQLFQFRQADLDMWEEDPEEWENQERKDGAAWEWAVRPCAERLLVDLLTYYKQELSPHLFAFCDLATKVDMPVITKESTYTALGCAVAIIHSQFDFDHFLERTLVHDVHVKDSLAKVLRRRIPILLSQWAPVRISQANMSTVYAIFSQLLLSNDQHNDMVVRLTAARELKFIADDFQFRGDQFEPFAASIFESLINMLREVCNDDSKVAVLDTLRIVISRMESHVCQYGDTLMLILPGIWSASNGRAEFMVRQSVLAIIAALVTSMRAESQRYHRMVLPLLREALNPKTAAHAHLLEDTLELWSSILLQSTPPLSTELVELVMLALPLLEKETDVGHTSLGIVGDYVVLAPQALLDNNLRRPILGALARALDAKPRDRIEMASKSIENLVRAAADMAGSPGVTIIAQDLHEVGFLRSAMTDLHFEWENNQKTGPQRQPSKISNTKRRSLLAILARLALADPAVFVDMLASFGDSLPTVWSWLADEWFASIDSIVDADQRKVSCLALTRLIELPPPMQGLVLARLQDYFSMWTELVAELRFHSDNGATDLNADYLVWTDSPPAGNEGDTAYERLEREIVVKDPVHMVGLYGFVMERLRDLVRRVGGEAAFEEGWGMNVDKKVIEEFRKLGTLKGELGKRKEALW